MMPFPKIHDLHVARVVVATVLLVWTVLVGLDAVLAAADEVKNMGQGNYGFVSGLTYVAYTLPRRAYTMFPTAAVIGALMGLGQLAATSELTALRALGISRRRLSVSVAAPLAVTIRRSNTQRFWNCPSLKRSVKVLPGRTTSAPSWSGPQRSAEAGETYSR